MNRLQAEMATHLTIAPESVWQVPEWKGPWAATVWLMRRLMAQPWENLTGDRAVMK
jgi:hypothetical protein